MDSVGTRHINQCLLGGGGTYETLYVLSGDSKMRTEAGEGNKTDPDRFNT